MPIKAPARHKAARSGARSWAVAHGSCLQAVPALGRRGGAWRQQCQTRGSPRGRWPFHIGEGETEVFEAQSFFSPGVRKPEGDPALGLPLAASKSLTSPWQQVKWPGRQEACLPHASLSVPGKSYGPGPAAARGEKAGCWFGRYP